jgi:methyl-accepting chemotaxis protein
MSEHVEKMKVKAQMSIGKRIIITVIFAFILLFAFYIVYLINNINIRSSYSEVINIAFEINKKTDQLIIILGNANTIKEQYRQETDPQRLLELRESFEKYSADFTTNFNELDELASVYTDYTTKLYSAQKGFNDFQKNTYDMFSAHENEIRDNLDYSSSLLAGMSQTAKDNTIRNMEILKEQADIISDETSEAVFTTMTWSNYAMFFIFGISFIGMTFLGYNLNKSISVPTKKVAVALHDISENGDLTTKLDIISSDEIGLIVLYFNRFINKLRMVISQVKESTYELTSSMDQIAATTQMIAENAQGQAAEAEEVTASMEGIAADSNKIASETQIQVKSLGSLNNKMENFSTVMDEVATKVTNTLELTESITGRAIKSKRSLQEMSESMNKIVASSREIKNIVTIINDISEQINLLSLNASIEAARAGEQGRGFAVVADQISKLADETAYSLKEIDNLITANNTEINTGISGFSQTTDLLPNIIEGFNTIQEMMNIINNFILSQNETRQDVNDTTSTALERSDIIKSSTEKQNTAVSEVVKSITEINTVSQSNAQGAIELAQNAKRMGELAETLKEEVDFFKI